jgi:RNA polymerase sigma-70 factor (ECF subfamily)
MEKLLEDEGATLQIHRILHKLEEPYKEVFQLRVFGELSFRKIGQIFDKTEAWARVTYHRARLKIKERMEEHGTEI